MKRIKIVIISVFVVSLILSVNYRAHAEDTSGSVSEYLKIIANNHDEPEIVYNAASELEKLTPATEEEIVGLFKLVGETRGDIQQKFINAISNTADPSLAPVFIRELKNKNPMRVAAACGMSGKLKLDEAVPGLIAVIERYGQIEGKADTGPERATVTAALALGKIRDERGLEVLVKYMGKLDGYDFLALAEFGAQALDILLEKIDQDHKSPAGISAVAAVSKITDPEAAPQLSRIIGQKAHPARKSAVAAMLNTYPEATTRHLLEMWEADKDPFLERRLLFHINKVRLRDPSLCPFLIHALKNSSSMYARKGAALALGRIGGVEAIAALEKAATYDTDYFVRVYADQALKMARESLEKQQENTIQIP
jgi:HEAT repeat protein